MTAPIVQVDEVAHGGWAVVIHLPTGADHATAVAIAQEIRTREFVDLRDPRWNR